MSYEDAAQLAYETMIGFCMKAGQQPYPVDAMRWGNQLPDMKEAWLAVATAILTKEDERRDEAVRRLFSGEPENLSLKMEG